jgi:tetratricopeptide (TPR) repeat protein
MSALPRPDVRPGPHRELVDALHQLHHSAGWPSLRALAGYAACSPTTISSVFSSARLPRWGTLELVVEAMGGDVERFHRLWLAAGRAGTGQVPVPVTSGGTRLAGRATELAVVRRHLEAGSGLLLVTGEAGIGKSRLVSSAVALDATGLPVATGCCLPLSASTALFPVIEALRGLLSAHRDDVLAAVARSPSYVATTLGRLLPELGSGNEPPDDEWSRHHLFLALATVLGHLHRDTGLALLLEDLHWADTATLDLVEHLLSGGSPVPLLGTWRDEDPTLTAANTAWFVRIRRLPGVSALQLAPLSRDGTRDQLALLTGATPSTTMLDAIHTRTRGQPLFTEQLATHATVGEPLPALLADLLDARLGDLRGAPWLAARALGVAERPLDPRVLAQVCDLGRDDLAGALHDLTDQRLLAPSRGQRQRAELRHPLLADAIRRRLVAGEAAIVHERIAVALAAQPGSEPSEVARHWQGAGDRQQELRWRLAAARIAAERFATHEELTAWRRVLELWPAGAARLDSPPASLHEVHVRAIDAALVAAEVDEVRRLVDAALRLDVPDDGRVEVLRRAGDFACAVGDLQVGLSRLDEAVAIHERLPPSASFVDALKCRAASLSVLGRHSESRSDIRRALDVVVEIYDPFRHRQMLSQASWYLAYDRDYDDALALARHAQSLPLPHADPVGDIDLAVTVTDVHLIAGSPATAVAESAATGLAAAERWQLNGFHSALLRYNVALAHLRAGDVRSAAAVVDPFTQGAVTFVQAATHVARAAVDVRRGLLPAALARFEAVAALPGGYSEHRADSDLHHADAELWAGLAASAETRLARAAAFLLPTDAAATAAPLVCQQARAAADLASARECGAGERRQVLDRLRTLVAEAREDPFGHRSVGTAAPAYAATWAAETARVAGTETVAGWAAAAGGWDRLARPHDAAYCRWRGARVSVGTGRGTIAARLLRRATVDAREHVPLSAEIRGLAG